MTSIFSNEYGLLLAMTDKLDESVGEIISALEEKGMLQNSIVVFASDNGAASEGTFS